jgi:hypothetical protein
MNEVFCCTRCGKEFKDFRVDLRVQTRVDRLREDGVWEFIPNLDIRSREVLCYDCFDKFTAAIGGEMNVSFQSPDNTCHNPAPNVDPCDGIVYDEPPR